MVAAQSARLRGFVGLARDSKQVSTLGSASTRGNRQANELPAEWSSDERVFWRVLKPTRPLTGSSIRLLIGMGSRRRSASQAIDLPSDGGVNFERLFTALTLQWSGPAIGVRTFAGPPRWTATAEPAAPDGNCLLGHR
jgi:hypothetical protein